MDSVAENNEIVEEFIQRKHGVDWNSRFHKEVKEEISRQKVLLNLIEKDVLVMRTLKTKTKYLDRIRYSFLQKNNIDYDIEAHQYIPLPNDSAAVITYLRMRADLESLKLKVTDTTQSIEYYPPTY